MLAVVIAAKKVRFATITFVQVVCAATQNLHSKIARPSNSVVYNSNPVFRCRCVYVQFFKLYFCLYFFAGDNYCNPENNREKCNWDGEIHFYSHNPNPRSWAKCVLIWGVTNVCYLLRNKTVCQKRKQCADDVVHFCVGQEATAATSVQISSSAKTACVSKRTCGGGNALSPHLVGHH